MISDQMLPFRTMEDKIRWYAIDEARLPISRRLTYLVSISFWNLALDHPAWNEPYMIREVHESILENYSPTQFN